MKYAKAGTDGLTVTAVAKRHQIPLTTLWGLIYERGLLPEPDQTRGRRKVYSPDLADQIGAKLKGLRDAAAAGR